MNKRLYDFSISNAVIVILAYVMVILFSIFSISQSETAKVGNIIFIVFLGLSFVSIIVYYGFLAIRVTSEGIYHLNKFIKKENIEVFVRPNYRVKYHEIVFRDKSIKYKKLLRKQIKKNEITVQHFLKHEDFILKYLNISEISQWSND
jgi:hypothetical protein